MVYYNAAAGAEDLPATLNHDKHYSGAAVILNPAVLEANTTGHIHYKSSAANNNPVSVSKNNPVILTNLYYRDGLYLVTIQA